VAWSAIGGVTQGAGVSLAFTLIVLRGAGEDAVRRISAMAQLVAYPIGAAGPLAVGALNAATGGWTVPLLVLAGCAVVIGVCGLVAGRATSVGSGPA
jgi:CP family cyanate transporter-like MFS transporter